MRNILYICTKNQYDWDSFIPRQVSSSTEMDISVLLPQYGIELDDIPISQVTVLENEGGEKNDSCIYGAISYQDFLEKVFLADLALVI
jgi:hypothetical protein